MRERHRRRGEGEAETEREEAGIKTGSGSMKPPNLSLREKRYHNVTRNRVNKQLVGKQNASSLGLRLQSRIVWTLKAH